MPSRCRMRPELPTRPLAWLALLVGPLLGCAGIITVIEVLNLDPLFSRPFAPEGKGFPLRGDWFFARAMHDGGHWVVLGSAFALLVLAVGSRFRRAWKRWSVPAFYLLLCVGLTTAITGVLKNTTNRYSPWSMDIFGGAVPYTGLFSGTPEPFHGGHSFPAGHAAGAFAWIGLYHLGLMLGVRRPLWWLIPGLALGGLFAWTQQVRGAHFLSHNLWTLGIAWMVATGLAWMITARGWWPRRPHRPTAELTAMIATIRPWLAGVIGLCFGLGLFSLDTTVEALGIGGPTLHRSLESLEFLLVGPGLGLICFFMVERNQRARREAESRIQAERERRLLVLGRMAAAVAHEVRNPLHNLRLISDELQTDIPALRDHPLRGHIGAAIERIDRAVDLVYQLARPGAEDEASAEVVVVVRESCAALALRFPTIAIDLSALPERAAVRCTASALRIMVDNLVRNALEAGGPVTITLRAERGQSVLLLCNPGSLPAGLGDAEGFLVSATSSKAGGLGLGLAISAQLAEAAGGAIRVSCCAGLVQACLELPQWREEGT